MSFLSDYRNRLKLMLAEAATGSRAPSTQHMQSSEPNTWLIANTRTENLGKTATGRQSIWRITYSVTFALS